MAAITTPSEGNMTDLRVLTIKQVAELVQLSPKTVMRAVEAGDLEASRLTQTRGGWRIREAAIVACLERRSNRGSDRPLSDARSAIAQPRRVAAGRRETARAGRL